MQAVSEPALNLRIIITYESVATLGSFPLCFAGLLIMSAIPKLFQGTFLVEFLLQPTQSTINRFALFYADFSIHSIHPLFRTFDGSSSYGQSVAKPASSASNDFNLVNAWF